MMRGLTITAGGRIVAGVVHSPDPQPQSDLPAPATASVSVAATVPGGAVRRASQKFTRSAPSETEHERRKAWGAKWGPLNRDAINQAMEANR